MNTAQRKQRKAELIASLRKNETKQSEDYHCKIHDLWFFDFCKPCFETWRKQ